MFIVSSESFLCLGMLAVCNRQLIFSAVRGAASAAAATKPVSGVRVKTFEIYRYNPDDSSSKPKLQVGSF
jgi:hypothetical protein